MNHRYLYLITHSCGHLASYKRMEPFTKAEYYQQMALVCPSCQAEAEAKARVAAPEEPPEPVLGRSAIWKRNRRPCEGCGKSASLREYDGRQPAGLLSQGRRQDARPASAKMRQDAPALVRQRQDDLPGVPVSIAFVTIAFRLKGNITHPI